MNYILIGVSVLVLYILYRIAKTLAENSRRNTRIKEAAWRAERLSKIKKEKAQVHTVTSIKPPTKPTWDMSIKKQSDLDTQQKEVIDKILDDETYDNPEIINLWASSTFGGLKTTDDKDVK